MALGPLDRVEAIVLHGGFLDGLYHGEVGLAATLRAAKGLAPIVDFLQTGQVRPRERRQTSQRRESGPNRTKLDAFFHLLQVVPLDHAISRPFGLTLPVYAWTY